MNKTQLVESVAKKAILTKKQAAAAVGAVIDSITETLKEGNSVTFIGFGTFSVRDRAARKAKNPQTGEEMMIPTTKVPFFKAGSDFKKAVK